MAVYVDDANIAAEVENTHVRSRPVYSDQWSHLMADTPRELHEFATGPLRMRRAYFQDHWPHPHYDLTSGKRYQALRHGAVEVTTREAVERGLGRWLPPVLVTASREGVTRGHAEQALSPVFDARKVLINGGARGGDTIGGELWHEWGGEVEYHRVSPAEWRRSRGAGYARNAKMVAKVAARKGECVSIVAPCTQAGCDRPEPHGSHGAAHCTQLAAESGLTMHAWEAAGDADLIPADPLAPESVAAADLAAYEAGLAWRSYDRDRALEKLADARRLDPSQSQTWDSYEERVLKTLPPPEPQPVPDPHEHHWYDTDHPDKKHCQCGITAERVREEPSAPWEITYTLGGEHSRETDHCPGCMPDPPPRHQRGRAHPPLASRPAQLAEPPELADPSAGPDPEDLAQATPDPQAAAADRAAAQERAAGQEAKNLRQVGEQPQPGPVTQEQADQVNADIRDWNAKALERWQAANPDAAGPEASTPTAVAGHDGEPELQLEVLEAGS